MLYKFKIFLAVLLCMVILAGCATVPVPTPAPTPTHSIAPEPVPTAEPAPTSEPSPIVTPDPQPSPTPIPTLEESFPLRLAFSSGAGGWSTEIVIQQDLSFTGYYGDSDMGAAGDGHPHGTMYICNFSGQFAQLTRIDEYSYALTLAELTSDYEEGKEWIEDQILYVSSVPYGMEDGTEFILYLPNAPTANLSWEFLSWWSGRFSETLDLFGLYNVEMGYGFFGSTLRPEAE